MENPCPFHTSKADDEQPCAKKRRGAEGTCFGEGASKKLPTPFSREGGGRELLGIKGNHFTLAELQKLDYLTKPTFPAPI